MSSVKDKSVELKLPVESKFISTAAIEPHKVILSAPGIRLRPFTEADLKLVLPWQHDGDILYFLPFDEIRKRSLDELKRLYARLSHRGYLFIIETPEKEVLGEASLTFSKKTYPEKIFEGVNVDLFLIIGRRSTWGKGYGRKILTLLMDFAFGEQKAKVVWSKNIPFYNRRSIRLMLSLGFREYQRNEKKIARPQGFFDSLDLYLTADKYSRSPKHSLKEIL